MPRRARTAPMMLVADKRGGFSLKSLNPVRAVSKVIAKPIKAVAKPFKQAVGVARAGLAQANQLAAQAQQMGIPIPPKIQAGLMAANMASDRAAKVGIGRRKRAKRGGSAMGQSAGGRYKSAVLMRF